MPKTTRSSRVLPDPPILFTGMSSIQKSSGIWVLGNREYLGTGYPSTHSFTMETARTDTHFPSIASPGQYSVRKYQIGTHPSRKPISKDLSCDFTTFTQEVYPLRQKPGYSRKPTGARIFGYHPGMARGWQLLVRSHTFPWQ